MIIGLNYQSKQRSICYVMEKLKVLAKKTGLERGELCVTNTTFYLPV